MGYFMTHCVYWIHHAGQTDLMSQGYIGVSNNFDRRMGEHFKLGQNRYLQFAIKKYGWDALVKKKILLATEDYCLDIENKLRPQDKIGWNIVAGGGMPPSSRGKSYKRKNPSWNLGRSMSPESAKKVSQSISILWQDPEYRQRMRDAHKGHAGPMVGKTHSEASKLKQSLSKLGKPSKKKGVSVTPEALANCRAAARVQWECLHCKKVGHGIGAKNRWHFDACKHKEQIW